MAHEAFRLNIDSVILKDKSEGNLLRDWIGNAKAKFTLLYRATKNGFEGSAFHDRVENKAPTLVLIKSQDDQKVFGGYAFQK